MVRSRLYTDVFHVIYVFQLPRPSHELVSMYNPDICGVNFFLHRTEGELSPRLMTHYFAQLLENQFTPH